MKTHLMIRALMICAASLLLGACEMTTFRSAPLAHAGCDEAVVGTWLSVDEDPNKNGEVVLRIDSACQLQMESLEKGEVRRSSQTALHLGEHGRYRYAWVDARWALGQFDQEHTVPADDVYLVRIGLEADRLLMWSVDDKAVAHAIIDGKLKGEVSFKDSDLFNRLTETSEPALLEHPGLFKDESAVFVRDADAAP